MLQLLSVLIILAFVGVGSRVCLAVNPRYALAFFALFPLISMPIWAMVTNDVFVWLKTYSVCLSAVLVMGLKVAAEKWRPLLYRIGYFIIFFNILELIVSEYLINGNILNPLAGLLLLVALPLPRAFHMDAASGDVCYDVGWIFLIGYTFWNFAGVYAISFGVATLFAVVHLAVPLYLTRGRPELYYQARTVSLSLIMLYRMYAPMTPLDYETQGWYSLQVGLGLSLVSLALAIMVVADRFGPWLRRGRAPAE